MKHTSINKIGLMACLLVAGSPIALAQWQTQSFDLAPGWNAIYTHVDTTPVSYTHLTLPTIYPV